MFLGRHFLWKNRNKKMFRQLLPGSQSNYIVPIFLKLISITSFAGSVGTDDQAELLRLARETKHTCPDCSGNDPVFLLFFIGLQRKEEHY